MKVAFRNIIAIIAISLTLGGACSTSSTDSSSNTGRSGGGNGACSSHGGVNCSAGADSDGSVICYDGWRDSSVSYSSVKKCN